MQPNGIPKMTGAATGPRMAGSARTVEEDEDLQLAMAILRLNHRLRSQRRDSRRP